MEDLGETWIKVLNIKTTMIKVKSQLDGIHRDFSYWKKNTKVGRHHNSNYLKQKCVEPKETESDNAQISHKEKRRS